MELRDVKISHGRKGRARVGLDEGLVVLARQNTHPGVEQLHGRGTGLHLHAKRRPGDLRQARTQPMPQLRVAVHHRLGVLVVLGRPALHEVRRKGERRAGESDQRGGAQLGQDQMDGLRDVREVLGRQLRKPV